MPPIICVLTLRIIVTADTDVSEFRIHDVLTMTGRVHPTFHHRLRRALAGGNVLTGETVRRFNGRRKTRSVRPVMPPHGGDFFRPDASGLR